ncbi:MAG: formate dehydrogenase accessory sulfurtransferase FdhD [Acidimicrobiales bacterium]
MSLDRARGRAELVTEVWRLGAGGAGATEEDHLAAEEPLEIRLGGTAEESGTPAAVVMRTPGDDFDLAWGLAITEQLVDDPGAIQSAHWGAPADDNAVDLRLRDGYETTPVEGVRPWLVSSACGLCGKDSVDAIRRAVSDLSGLGPVLPVDVVVGLPERLRAGQGIFDSTGGLHAAGAFTARGEPVCVREDIGRHNAVDKVVGHLARRGELPAHELVLVVSGRAGFEIVQKAAVAGFTVLVSVSAPSSIAVQLALETGMTLAGFVRQGRANVYSGRHRVIPAGAG